MSKIKIAEPRDAYSSPVSLGSSGSYSLVSPTALMFFLEIFMKAKPKTFSLVLPPQKVKDDSQARHEDDPVLDATTSAFSGRHEHL